MSAFFPNPHPAKRSDMPHRPPSSNSSTTPSRSRTSSEYVGSVRRHQSLFTPEASQQSFTDSRGEALLSGFGSAALQNNSVTGTVDYDIALQGFHFPEKSPSYANHACTPHQLSERPWSSEARRSRPCEADTTKSKSFMSPPVRYKLICTGSGVVSPIAASSAASFDSTLSSGSRSAYSNHSQGQPGDYHSVPPGTPIRHHENFVAVQADNAQACACPRATIADIALRWDAVLEYERNVLQRERNVIQRQHDVFQYGEFLLSLYSSLQEQGYVPLHGSSPPPSAQSAESYLGSRTPDMSSATCSGPTNTMLASAPSTVASQQHFSLSSSQDRSTRHTLSQQQNQLAAAQRANTPALEQIRSGLVPLSRLSSTSTSTTTRSTSSFPISCWVEGCNVTFSRDDDVFRHWQDLHSGMKYRCKICGELRGRKDLLARACRKKHDQMEGDGWYEWIKV